LSSSALQGEWQMDTVSWHKKIHEALDLNGKSERTKECYLRAVRQIRDHYKTEPEELSETQIREYFLYRKNTSKWPYSTLKICCYGIRFYYQNVMLKKWHIFELFKAPKEKPLPSRSDLANPQKILVCTQKW